MKAPGSQTKSQNIARDQYSDLDLEERTDLASNNRAQDASKAGGETIAARNCATLLTVASRLIWKDNKEVPILGYKI